MTATPQGRTCEEDLKKQVLGFLDSLQADFAVDEDFIARRGFLKRDTDTARQ